MESVLQGINREFIALRDDEIRRNNRILDSVLKTLIAKMKENDALFAAMYRDIFYGGSYYDGLKIGAPKEFDLDILLSLPKLSDPVLTTSNIPGFVHLQLRNLDRWMNQPEARPAYNNFGRFFDDKKYLCTDRVLSWIQSLVQRTLNDFGGNGGVAILRTKEGIFQITDHEGGPARTLNIFGAGVSIDVDLVACFIFGSDKWPANGFKRNPVPSKPNFFIVPKRPKDRPNAPIPRYWRLSFQEQERVLIDNKRTLKPTVKLLKRLKENLGHKCIASYYIKTVILHVVDKNDDDFWRKPLSHVFMVVLKEYKSYIERKNLPYYWNKNNNLLAGISPVTLENINGRLGTVIRDLETRPEAAIDYFKPQDSKKEYNETTQPNNNSCNLS